MERNIVDYLHLRRKNPMSKSRDVIFDCCDAICWSCGNTYYANAKYRELHKCYRCREEKRLYNPDIAPLNSVEIDQLK